MFPLFPESPCGPVAPSDPGVPSAPGAPTTGTVTTPEAALAATVQVEMSAVSVQTRMPASRAWAAKGNEKGVAKSDDVSGPTAK